MGPAPEKSGRAPGKPVGVPHRTCALLGSGAVKCWGNNDHGKLGIGDERMRGLRSSEMGDMLPTVNLGAGRTAVYLASSAQHTCAVLDTGAVKCWGVNSFGQLGLGDERSRDASPDQMGDALPAVDLGEARITYKPAKPAAPTKKAVYEPSAAIFPDVYEQGCAAPRVEVRSLGNGKMDENVTFGEVDPATGEVRPLPQQPATAPAGKRP